jgi:hypothetical protein
MATSGSIARLLNNHRLDRHAGISGEMIRDVMGQRVDKRFDAFRAPARARNGSRTMLIFAVHRTIEIALVNSPYVHFH